MQIKILGTRGEIEGFTPQHKKYSGVLIDDVLFDVGEKEYLDLKPKAIFVSHLHPDHAFWVKSKEEVDLEYYHPGNLKVLKPVKAGDLTVLPIPTIHSKTVKSVAFLIKKGNLSVLYTSDMIWIRKRYHKHLKDLDLVITDGSFIREGGMIRKDKETGEIYGHQGIPDLVKLFSRLGAKRIMFTHFGEWMIKDPKKGKEKIREFSNDVQVDAAEDGELITLEETNLEGTTTKETEPIIPRVIAKLQPKVGLYLVKPHAEMIITGDKTLIVKSKKFTAHINEPLYLLEDKVCWGIITLKEPQEITPEEFEKLRGKHRITDKEAFEHWGWKKNAPLYAYEFSIDSRFEPPLPVRLPRGVQVFVDAENIKFLELKELSILELLNYKDIYLTEEAFVEVAEELHRRKLWQSQLFVLIKGWIEDYDVKAPNDRQLGDDYRIVLGWYSSLKEGKKLFKRVGEEKKEITLADCKALALKIFKEMIRRGSFTFNKPETYKKHARELYEWLISQVGEENIPWKDKEEENKLVPSKVTRADLEQIDPEYIKTLSDEELKTLDKRLHEIYQEIGKVTEPLENAHIFVWSEMRRRKIPHTIDDELTRKTMLEVIEYPKPEIGLPQRISLEEMAKMFKLDEVLAAFPEKVTIEDPIHVYLCGGIVNRGEVEETHDLDILFKQGWYHVPTIRAFLDQVTRKNPEVAKRLHFVWDVNGPQIGYSVPLYRLAFEKVSDEEMRRTSPFEFLAGTVPQLFKPHIGMKPKSGFEKFEFWDPQELWDKWAKDYIDRGLIIQKKYDGMRFQIHCQGNKIKVITEDRQRDRAEAFKKSVKELLAKKKADSFIIDAEMVEYQCGRIETKNYEEICEPIEREQMIKWIAAKAGTLDDERIVFHVHDCVYLNGKPIADKGYEERWNAINQILPMGLVHWRKVPGAKAEEMRSFFKLVKKFRSMRGSEGVVAKAANSTYKIKYSGEARTGEWAKLKNLKEIDVKVWKVVQKKTREGKPLPQYLYECIFSIPCSDVDKYREKDVVKMNGKCYLYIGRSYATAQKVKPGDIIVVRPIRVAEFKDEKGKLYYTWMFPYYDGMHPAKKEPDSIDVVKKLVAAGTGPLKLSKGTLVFRLQPCPFWRDERVCPLKERFIVPRDQLSTIKIEYLKYPIVCKFANHYRCRYVKSYYYGFKEYEVKSEVDEDTGEEIKEETGEVRHED